MSRFEGKTALVTGGARGIGAAVARRLVAEGARVVIGDVLAQAEWEVGLPEARVRRAHLDVTSEADWFAAVTEAERVFGHLDVVVNNAGIVEFGPITEQSPESFRRVLEVNLVGPWLGMRAVAPSLRAAGGGSIVNISSTAGLIGYADLGAYVASKWALRGLTKTAAMEFARDGIRVCSVHPGPIRTPMTAGFDDSMTAEQPIARFGDPEEVAAMVAFVAAEATYSTGSEFVVDGGAVVAGAGVRPDRAEVGAGDRG
ncbi:SDR family oxidoreductase [Actinokineospora auranticolor]|uniref:3alpha(Or 20beta)-hydroxysteroid dehydrogenase n=1 Tax=Actinokineospora auranticolor TaxID=155976 RepID=A0A2S6GPU4_9PSEU|nr:SDR family oxidoreductase [Actinokineospora auranticolor]PPK67248.1 3alpha(or 20beta)-hydroxysteroid dehydrogenase [Actinokineospora auranticolor]